MNEISKLSDASSLFSYKWDINFTKTQKSSFLFALYLKSHLLILDSQYLLSGKFEAEEEWLKRCEIEWIRTSEYDDFVVQ